MYKESLIGLSKLLPTRSTICQNSSHDIKILIKRVISAKHTYVISFKNVFVIVTAFLVFFFSVDQDPIKFGRRSCISLWLTNRHITCFPGVPTYIKYTCSLFSGRIYLHHVNTVFDLSFSIKRNLVIHNHIYRQTFGRRIRFWHFRYIYLHLLCTFLIKTHAL